MRLKQLNAIEETLRMTRAQASLIAAILALAVLSQPGDAFAQPVAYPPEHVAWRVGPSYFGCSGIPWPGPPFAWPDPKLSSGCYDTRARVKGAWRQVEVCY